MSQNMYINTDNTTTAIRNNYTNNYTEFIWRVWQNWTIWETTCGPPLPNTLFPHQLVLVQFKFRTSLFVQYSKTAMVHSCSQRFWQIFRLMYEITLFPAGCEPGLSTVRIFDVWIIDVLLISLLTAQSPNFHF